MEALLPSQPGLAHVEPVSEALARYARAQFDRTAAVEALAEFRGRPGGSSSPLSREQRLVADVRRAHGEVTEAHDGLIAVGVADPRRAWRKAARLLPRLAGGGLPGGRTREQFKRGGPTGASPMVPVRRPRIQANDHLLADVNLLLWRWRDQGKTNHPSVGIEDLQRALDESPPTSTDLRGMAHNIAEYLAHGAVTRLRGGAVGVEIEQHNVFLFWPERPGEPLHARDWLVRSPDGLVRVVADIGVAWASDEGQLYESRVAMQAAGAAPHPATAGGRLAVTVPETVTAPFRALNEPRRDWDDVLRRLDELDAYWGRAPGDSTPSPMKA